jgi:D-tyrosyl-tRNA(Tyr) deacylase
MRAVVQRVDGARVLVDGEVAGAIEGPGVCLLVGVTHSDTVAQAQRLADKVHQLRIFDEESLGEAFTGECFPPGSPRELSASDLNLPLLVVSQFTLYGSTRKGRRPTWDAASGRDHAEPLVAAVAARLRARGAFVAEGRFGSLMRVELVNDGPFTLVLDVD